MLTTNLALKAIPEEQPPEPQQSYLLMTKADIPAFLALQAKVIAALPEDKKHYLKPRTAEDLEAHLSADMPVIVVKDHDGKIIAQALVTLFNSPAAKNLGDYPNIGTDPKAAVQAVQVDPDARGKKLSEVLLNAAKIEAAKLGAASLLAKVATDNDSQKSFISTHFTKAAENVWDKAGRYFANYFQVALAKSEPLLRPV